MKSILAAIKLPAIQENSLLAKLSGVTLAIFVVLLIILVIFVVKKFNLSKKLKTVLEKVFKYIFWNFLIRYLQVAFINLNYASLTSVLTTDSLFDKIVSANILAVLYLMVCLVGYILYSRPHEYLCLESTRQMIGNMYLNLNTMFTEKKLFGAIFFI